MKFKKYTINNENLIANLNAKKKTKKIVAECLLGFASLLITFYIIFLLS